MGGVRAGLGFRFSKARLGYRRWRVVVEQQQATSSFLVSDRSGISLASSGSGSVILMQKPSSHELSRHVATMVAPRDHVSTGLLATGY